MLDDEQRNPIQRLVAERGGMRFRDFMEMALYDPMHGYYGAGRAVMGREGDYFTSVSVGKVFGELLGWQFQEMWERLGRPPVFTIVEQGANDGTFAKDVLGWCREKAPDFFEATRYEIVEGIDVLRGRQAERLGEFGEKVGWRGGLDELARFTGVHFSNELVDAFPVHLARYRDGEWRELYVTEPMDRLGELRWSEKPLTDAALIEGLADAPRIEGYTTEVNLDAPKWAEGVASKIERGWVLTIDYGFPRARYYARSGGRGRSNVTRDTPGGWTRWRRPAFATLRRMWSLRAWQGLSARVG